MKVAESPESASPLVTRAVAAALTGGKFQSLEIPGWQRRALQLADLVTPGLLPNLVRFENKRRALPWRAAAAVDVERLAADRVADYRGWKGFSSCALMGSALGGAAAYLGAVLGAPFLPEPFILAFRGGSPQDHVEPHLEMANSLADVVSRNNPTTHLISHFDPVHDGWLTSDINHLRLKLGKIPEAYKAFLKEHLQPGGTILHLDCQAEWMSYQLNDRHHYQIGGWGGIPPLEYYTGSARIDRFLAEKGSAHRGGWRVAGIKPGWAPESEWGSTPAFSKALRAWAKSEGYRYQPISFRVPHHFSALAYFATLRLYTKLQLEPRGVFIGMFNQYDPSAVMQRVLLPVWLVFNTEDSLRYLRNMTGLFPQIPVYFSALVTYSLTPDMVPWQQWQQSLAGLNWSSIGARKRRYPKDTTSLWKWQERLRQQTAPARRLGPRRLTVDELIEEINRVRRNENLIPHFPLSKRKRDEL